MPGYCPEHWTVLDNPKQIWYERFHHQNRVFAEDCLYSEAPYDDAFEGVLEHFAKYGREAERLRVV